MKNNFQHLIKAVGVYENACLVFRQLKPELIIFSNDHIPSYRAIALAAKRTGIAIAYIQHACVSDDFPNLIYDLSLLEGQDSLDKYKGGEGNLHVDLVGMPKYDNYVAFTRKADASITRIGLVYNLLESPEEIQQIVHLISTSFPGLELVVRPHPRDDRLLDVSDLSQVLLSNSKDESAFDFCGL